MKLAVKLFATRRTTAVLFLTGTAVFFAKGLLYLLADE
jgi:hypothetical protein